MLHYLMSVINSFLLLGLLIRIIVKVINVVMVHKNVFYFKILEATISQVKANTQPFCSCVTVLNWLQFW
uniref:Uncharacterized protein n=1 Tax=Anguilla anguilla TaxID=7936 RepID=A0A0E9VT46_ANGAN